MAVAVIEIILLAIATAHLVWSFHVAPEIRVRQMSLIGYVLVLVLAAMTPPVAGVIAFAVAAFGVGMGALMRGDRTLWLQASLVALACALVLPERWWLAGAVIVASIAARIAHAAMLRRTWRRAERQAIAAIQDLGEWGQMDERFSFACQLVRDGRTARLHDERLAAYRQALRIARQIAQQQPDAHVDVSRDS